MCIHTHTYTHIHIYLYKSPCVYTYIHTKNMYTHVCVHVHTGHVTWSMSTLGVVAAINGCVWVCCNGHAMTPALSRSVSQRTGWRSQAVCPLVFPLVWILLAVPPQCHLGCSCPLWEVEKNGSWIQRLTFKVFYFSITFIYSWRTLFIYKIRFHHIHPSPIPPVPPRPFFPTCTHLNCMLSH